MRVLVVNAGSSSLKLRVLDGDDAVVASADVDPGDGGALDAFVAGAPGLDAVGHRVVHGGPRHTAPVVLDDAVVTELRALVPLAPLHQPQALAGIEAVGRALPGVPAVACFDTAFHSTLSAAARTYPLPREWRERFGLRRYGFHGLSHAYAARRAAELVDGHPARRIVTCHLGAGSSLAAVVDGRCVDTTMGFTPNEGIPMATRSGSVDVGMLTWLLDQGVAPAELDDGLQRRSGLTGLAGTGDMRALTDAAGRGEPDARLAVEVWLHRLCSAVGAMAASTGGLDVLVFTGGIGEHSPSLRAAVADRLGWLGVAVSPQAELARDGNDGDVSPPAATVRTLVVNAREDIEIARDVRATIDGGQAGRGRVVRRPMR